MVLLAVLGLASCQSSGEQWSLPLTRAILESDSEYRGFSDRGEGLSGGPEMFLLVLVPFAVDVVLLPVTLPHDLLFMD